MPTASPTTPAGDPSPRFEFATAARIVFGAPAVEGVPAEVAATGRRVFAVVGHDPGRSGPMLDALRARGLAVTPFPVSGEPTVELVKTGVDQARKAGSDVVLGFGGGSVLDAAKAVAILLGNGGDPLDYLEVIGAGKKFARPSAPMIAVPTTAGTGSEVTMNAVLASPAHRRKASLRSPFMFPRLAWIDPDLTLTVPPAATAHSGMDALSQLVEPFVSRRAGPLTDGICREGMLRSARALRRAVRDGGDRDARSDLAFASLCGGLALANAALGAVHGLAGPLGGMFDAPHGALCAVLLAPVMEANLRALREREPGNPARVRYDEVARILTERADARAEDGVRWVRELCADLKIAPLTACGLTPQDIPAAAEMGAVSSSMKGNPVTLLPKEVQGILESACRIGPDGQ